MINDGINNVPDNTIAIFTSPENTEDRKYYDSTLYASFDKDRINTVIHKSPRKRDWFNAQFYRCLPLTIGNQYGFIIKNEIPFLFKWNGGDKAEDLEIKFHEWTPPSMYFPQISSHFGYGIITLGMPIVFRTPPGINLMTINPPNYIVPNLSVMTGVVESDNLRRDFTINLRVMKSEEWTEIPPHTPLAAILPIPRYFQDGFELKFADEIFDEKILNEEFEAKMEHYRFRDEEEPKLHNGLSKHYFNGVDAYGNTFKDHQGPNLNKFTSP